MPKITFIQKDGSKIEVNAEVGKTLLEVAEQNNIEACQVVVSEEMDGAIITIPE